MDRNIIEVKGRVMGRSVWETQEEEEEEGEGCMGNR